MPSFLEILLQAAPQFLQAYTQGQMLSQQKELTAAQIATAQAQGTAANLEVGQMQAGQQANIDNALAAILQGQQEKQNYILPAPVLPPRQFPVSPSTQVPSTPPAAITGPLRQTRPQPTLSPDTLAVDANPANRATAAAFRREGRTPEIDARLALMGQDVTKVRERQRILSTFPEAQRGWISRVMDLKESGVPADVVNYVSSIDPNRPQSVLEKLQLEEAEIAIRTARSNESTAQSDEANDRTATTALVSAGLLPKGTEYHKGAADRLLQFNIARRTSELGQGGLSNVQKVVLDLYRDNNTRQRSVEQPARNALGIVITEDGRPVEEGGVPVMEFRNVPMSSQEIWTETIDAASRILGAEVVQEAVGGMTPPPLPSGPAAPITPAAAQTAREIVSRLAAQNASPTEIEARLVELLAADGVRQDVARGFARSLVRERVTARTAR